MDDGGDVLCRLTYGMTNLMPRRRVKVNTLYKTFITNINN